MQNSNSRTGLTKSFPRTLRSETRNRVKDELKRVINALDKVRKWERRWVVIKDSSINVYKWVPVTGQSVLSTKTTVPKVVVSGEETNASLISADNSNDETNVTSRVNEDSNAAFSEVGFDCDSNQTGTFDRFDYKNEILTNNLPQTDFSEMVREEANRSCNANDNMSTPTRKRASTSLNDESTPTRKSSRY